MEVKVDTVQINFRLSLHKVTELKRLSREMSLKQSKDIKYTDLIRNAIAQVYFYESDKSTAQKNDKNM